MANRGVKLDFAINADGCFLCTSHKRRVIKGDYETTRVKRYGRYMLLHRWIFEEMHGPIPDNMVILHKCDNSLCINPEHMELGTQKENMQDMKRKGRGWWQNGYKNGSQRKNV